MKTLVTGGAGFIGSNLVDALLARGDEVTVVDDLSTGRRGNLDGALAAGAELVELDIRDGAALSALAAERRPEAIFHLAAQIDVRKSLEDPAFDAAVNVGGTANVLDAARAADARRVVFVSTGGAIYGEGEGQQLPLDEGRADRADVRLRPEQVRRRGLPRPLRAPLRPLQHRPAARQRLRPAPGPARRGRRDRDLLRPAAVRRPPDRVRRRHPDPRLHICGRRGRGGADRGRVRASAARSTSAPGSRPTCSSWPRRWAGSAAPRTSSPSSRRRGPARSSASPSTPAAPSASSAGAPRPSLDDGLRLTLDAI